MSATARQRIDLLLVETGLFPSRESARAAVLAGEVRVDGVVVTKAGREVERDAAIEVAPRRRFVSRGGDKLAGALEAFDVVVAGRHCVDVGASTGGFTDCLLQEGAASVVAVDVGYGQLAWSLRNDQRVVVRERTNIRYVEPADLGAPFGLLVADVSFISLTKVVDVFVSLLGPKSDLLLLVKPQFEAGKERVGKRGVVSDPAVHTDVLGVVMEVVEDAGLVVRGVAVSPIKGPEGNIEFWIWAATTGEAEPIDVAAVVSRAHETLGG